MRSFPPIFARAFAACLTTLLVAAPAALAASGEDRTPLELGSEPARQNAQAGGGGIARMVVGLAVVLAVIYGLSWVVKQVKASREGQASGSALAAVASLPLGPNRSVHLVRVGSDLVLLGAAERGVTPIRAYAEHEAIAAGLLDEDVVVAAAPARVLPALPAAGGTSGSLIAGLRRRTVRR